MTTDRLTLDTDDERAGWLAAAAAQLSHAPVYDSAGAIASFEAAADRGLVVYRERLPEARGWIPTVPWGDVERELGRQGLDPDNVVAKAAASLQAWSAMSPEDRKSEYRYPNLDAGDAMVEAQHDIDEAVEVEDAGMEERLHAKLFDCEACDARRSIIERQQGLIGNLRETISRNASDATLDRSNALATDTVARERISTLEGALHAASEDRLGLRTRVGAVIDALAEGLGKGSPEADILRAAVGRRLNDALTVDPDVVGLREAVVERRAERDEAKL